METFWFFRLRFRRAYDSAYDSDFRFSLGHKISYDSESDNNNIRSVATENQPLWLRPRLQRRLRLRLRLLRLWKPVLKLRSTNSFKRRKESTKSAGNNFVVIQQMEIAWRKTVPYVPNFLSVYWNNQIPPIHNSNIIISKENHLNDFWNSKGAYLLSNNVLEILS